ncbi:MAG: TolC family protein [Nitrospirae bacterium]|nr:MAG: TolC family protein [Nitrospirota bacterium]
MDTVMDIIDQYYEVCYRKAVLKGAEFALDLSTSVLEEVKLKIKEGLLPRVDIYEAEADLSKRETELETAQAEYSKALERLWFLLGGNTEGEPSDCQPVVERVSLVLENYIKIAHERHPEVLRLKEELKSKEVMVGFYKNALLPELDITTSVGVGGVAERRGEALDLLREGGDRNWAIGVSLSLPLERGVDKARYRKAVFEKEKVETSLEDTLKKIELQVKEGILDYNLARKRIETAGKLREATEKRYEAGREMFAQGLVGINDLLRYQKDYIDATVGEKKAVLDSARAYYRLQRVSGLILDAFGIKLID